MILLTHPFGNANVRAVLDAFYRHEMLAKFVTTIGWSTKSYPDLAPRIRGALRRNYNLPADKIDIHPLRESVRLLAGRLGWRKIVEHEIGWASIDRVWQSIDRESARRLGAGNYGPQIKAVYAYEDCAENLFAAAAEGGLSKIYDLPIAYWQTSQRLLQQEAERYPDWEPTLLATRDSTDKLARKTREIEGADLVICPSKFVLDSLPETIRARKQCMIAPFGSPDIDSDVSRETPNKRLRVLFAGAMTQRKGLADLFAAVRSIGSSSVELVVAGSLLRPLDWYRQQLAEFTYEPPRSHREFLEVMQSCDLLVLPSIVEGRALVQQEAMMCGLPLIVTPNTGGDDLIVEGETGFTVAIRDPEALAERIAWCAENRAAVHGMGIAAQRKAREFTWADYGDKIVAAVRQWMSK